MNQPEILDSDIRAMQQWLRAAWQQLGDPSLTTFSRRELRNQMKQCSADLRERLQMVAEQQSEPAPAAGPGLLPGRSCASCHGDGTRSGACRSAASHEHTADGTAPMRPNSRTSGPWAKPIQNAAASGR